MMYNKLWASQEPLSGTVTVCEPCHSPLPSLRDQQGQLKLWGLHGSYSYIVNTSSPNPCSENNQIFRLSNCFSCLVTSSPTMSALENVSGLPSKPLCVYIRVCVYVVSFFPPCGPFFLSLQNWPTSCYALELLNTYIYVYIYTNI